jgi:hypothetical protein
VIIPPHPRYVGLELGLAGLTPGRIVALGNPYRRVTKKNCSLYWDAFQEQLNRESVAKAVCVAIGYARDLTQAPERAPPVASERVLRSHCSPDNIVRSSVVWWVNISLHSGSSCNSASQVTSGTQTMVDDQGDIWIAGDDQHDGFAGDDERS